MSETDHVLTRRLREADVPPFDATAVIAGATVRGRRTVLRRRGAATVASLAVVAVVGGLATSGFTTVASPDLQVANTATPEPTPEPEPTETPDTDPRPTPYGGSWHSLIVDKVTDRTVGRIGPVEPIPTDAPRGREGATSEIEKFTSLDHPRSTMTLDAIATEVRFTWGTQPFTREEGEFYERTLGKEFDELELESSDFSDPMKQCRKHQVQEASGYDVSACTEGPDGSAWYTFTLLMPAVEEYGPQARRGAVVLHANSWVLAITQEDGKTGPQPDYDRMASPEELLKIAQDGDWFL